MAYRTPPVSIGLNPTISTRRAVSLPGITLLALNTPRFGKTIVTNPGVYVGLSTDKAKILRIINIATGGGFTWEAHKLSLNKTFKPSEKHSTHFRSKFIKFMHMPNVRITLHFATRYKEYNEKGKFVTMHIRAGEGVTAYANRQGTEINIILWGDEKVEQTIPPEYKKKIPGTMAAVLIHELNVHAYPTLSMNSRNSYAIMRETKLYLDNGVGIPEMYKQHWEGMGMKIHDSKINKTKGNMWRVPY